MSEAVVVLPPMAAPVDQLWHVLLDLGDRLTVEWALIGGQMVLLHALEHGQVPPQISQDGDVIADIRADQAAVTKVVAELEALGFQPDEFSTDGLAHRYIRTAEPRPVAVDVLAPEGLGERADLTTSPPGRTVQVPGGTQALARSERIIVEHEGRRGPIPRPTLLGALIGKGAACGLPGDPSRHLRDLALLCALADDPFELADQLTKKERAKLRLGSALQDGRHPAWLLVPSSIRAHGQITYGVLTNQP